MVADETLAWTRPNYFALLFELVASTGVIARVSVNGIGPERHVLAKTADGEWRFDLFPLDRLEAQVTSIEGGDPVAIFWRGNPVEVRFFDGETFDFRAESPLKTQLEDSHGTLVFSIEMVETFPRWRAEMKFGTVALGPAKRAILLCSACCYLVFTGTHRHAFITAEQTSVQGG